MTRVKPERDTNNRESYRRNWWTFGEPRREMRPALAGSPRCIATVETAKHRTFQFLDATIAPDNKRVVIALDDAFFHGVLSSRIHGVYALAAGSWLGVGNDPVYAKSRCFETFPFPTATEAQQTHIRDRAERLDTHRKRQQAQHPKLTLTDLCNVLEKLRAGTPLNAKEQLTHEHGLVTVFRQLHDDLAAAVASAYALPPSTSDEAILTHLCALNTQRAAEERTAKSAGCAPPSKTRPAPPRKPPSPPGTTYPRLPPSPKPRVCPGRRPSWGRPAPRAALQAFAGPADAVQLAGQFKRERPERIADLLETLASLGQARTLPAGRYASA